MATKTTSTRSLNELQREIATLQKEAEAVRAQEKAGVIDRIKEAIATYELTAADLGFATARKARRKSSVKPNAKVSTAKSDAVKYRRGADEVWGGRGPRPRWLRDAIAGGATLEQFAV